MSKITMTGSFSLKSDNGIIRYFHLQEQYDFDGKELKPFPENIDEKKYHGTDMYSYKVTRDEEVFWVPKVYAVEYGVPYDSPYVTNKGLHEHYMMGNERMGADVNKAYKEVFGRVIDNRYRPDISYNYAKLLRSAEPKKSKP